MNTPPVPFSRLIAYLRKSRDDGEDSVEAVLERHEKILQDYCLRTYNAPLPPDRIYREVMSGETIASRPVVQEVLRQVQERMVDGVLVVELQRLSRGDFSDIGELERIFLYTGCKIVTPMRTLSLKDDYDKSYFEMELLHGREYLSYVKKILRRGVEQSSREGNYVSAVPPFGYRRAEIDKKPSLEPDPEEAPTVRRIFEWYAHEQIGPTLISDRLNRLGIHGRDGGEWNPARLRHILENPVYTGRIRWGYRRGEKQYRDGSLVTVKSRRTDDSVILVPGKHDAIISDELFEEARSVAAGRKVTSQKKDARGAANPLAGLLRCSVCGHTMIAVPTYRYHTREVKDYTMRCTYAGGCGIRGAYLHDVLSVLRDTLSSTLEDLTLSQYEKEKDPSEDLKKLYEAELADLTRQQERLYGFLERGTYTEDVFRERSQIIKTRTEEIRAALDKLSEQSANEAQAKGFRAGLQNCLNLLNDPSTPPRTLNTALKKILSRIDYTRPPRPSARNEFTPITLKLFYT